MQYAFIDLSEMLMRDAGTDVRICPHCTRPISVPATRADAPASCIGSASHGAVLVPVLLDEHAHGETP